jgi:hypothetical protein
MNPGRYWTGIPTATGCGKIFQQPPALGNFDTCQKRICWRARGFIPLGITLSTFHPHAATAPSPVPSPVPGRAARRWMAGNGEKQKLRVPERRCIKLKRV